MNGSLELGDRASRSGRNQPNFIVFITDQQRADYLGCYGHPVLQTPHIDAIARRGTRFGRCYVAAPVCMPNRASLMTGRMPSVHGVRMNGIPLSQRQTTFVESLRAHGYMTALIGKSHLQNMVDVPPFVKAEHNGNEPRIGPVEAVGRECGDYGQELPMRWRGIAPLRLSLPYYGFQHVDLCTGHGDLVGGHYYQWLRTKVGNPEALRGPEHSLSHDYSCPQAWRTAVPEELYPTSYIGDRSIEFLSDPSRAEQPFLLFVSFPDPHHPFTPPGRYWDMYRPEDMVLDRSFGQTTDLLPQVSWAQAERKKNPAILEGYGAFAVNERECREAMALTCGMIGMIDDTMGRIMRCVADRGLSSNTVIIFTSDHGDLLGDHGLMLKGPVHFQSLLRVPLIWSDPQAKNLPPLSSALSSTIDIAASILERAQVPPYNGLQGRSLLPALDGRPTRKWVLVEEDTQEALFGLAEASQLRTLVTDQYRLTICDNSSSGELFDLLEDPGELHNLWDVTDYQAAKARLLEAIARAQMEAADHSPMPLYLA